MVHMCSTPFLISLLNMRIKKIQWKLFNTGNKIIKSGPYENHNKQNMFMTKSKINWNS